MSMKTQLLCGEELLDTITVEGVTFEVIRKGATYYAGFHAVAPDNESEPDGTFEAYMAGQGRIQSPLYPERMVAVSIGYAGWDKTYPLEFLHGKETASPVQPEGIYVLEGPPSLFIRLERSPEAWKLTKKVTGQDDPGWHMAPLFLLVRQLICTERYGYRFCENGNYEMENYDTDGSACVYVPVERD